MSTHDDTSGTGFLFVIFCVWTFVLIGRPQDMFQGLAVLRPALVMNVMIICVYISYYSKIASRSMSNSSQLKWFMILVCVMITSVPFAYHRRLAFMFMSTVYVNAILYFFFFYNIVNSIEKLERVLFLGCFGALLYSIFSVVKGATKDERLWFGTMFDPNDLCYFIISFVPLNFIFLSNDNDLFKKLIGFGNIIIGTVLILKTASRGGFIALCIVLYMLFVRKTHTISAKYRVIFIILFLVIVTQSLDTLNYSRLETILKVQEDYNVTDEEGRLSIWETGLRLMLSHPLTGVGVDCFAMAIGQDRVERSVKPVWQAAHNSLVQIGTETGVLGFILFIVINIKAFRIFGQVKKQARSEALGKIAEMARVGFTGQFISSMFLSQAYSIYWVFYIVFSAVLDRYFKDE